MRKQVIVKLGDRHWDSIRDTDNEAMFRVTEHMKKDHDPRVACIGDLVHMKLIFGKGASEGVRVFTEQGFEVEIKDINDIEAIAEMASKGSGKLIGFTTPAGTYDQRQASIKKLALIDALRVAQAVADNEGQLSSKENKLITDHIKLLEG